MSPLLTTRLSPFKEVFVKCVSTQGTYYIKLVSNPGCAEIRTRGT